jgi:hypothetical protein
MTAAETGDRVDITMARGAPRERVELTIRANHVPAARLLTP